VVTRWYRAPEVMCSVQHYDAKIDVWSLGCILAELHGRQPLFPGEDYIRQMNLIFNVLGTPSDDDMTFITNPKAKNYIKSLKKRPPKPFSKIYKNASEAATDLMEKMLQFNPGRRISVDDALRHPYFKSLHNPKKEVECKEQFDFTFEREKMTAESLRDFMWEEIFHFRSDLKDQADALKTKERLIRKQLASHGGASGGSASAAPSASAAAVSSGPPAAPPPPPPVPAGGNAGNAAAAARHGGSSPTPASTPVGGPKPV